jgi:membrane-associated phospholipid phosphatase
VRAQFEVNVTAIVLRAGQRNGQATERLGFAMASVAFLAACLFAGAAFADEVSKGSQSAAPHNVQRMPTPLDGLGLDLASAFTGWNLLWYGGAVAATAAMSPTGLDHAIRVGVQRELVVAALADSANYAGYLLPIATAPALYVAGLVAHDPITAGAGSAALQSLGTALVATGVLKISVGRVYPLNGGDPNAPDRLNHPEFAHTFRPFQSVTWPFPAWPSGHTSSTVSVAAALAAYYPEELWVPLVGYPLAVAIGFGMVDGDRHWASDVIAGGLIGQGIGYSVGRAFYQRVRQGGQAHSGATVIVVPVATGEYQGVAMSCAW